VIQIENELFNFGVKIMITHILHFEGDKAELRILLITLIFVVGTHGMFITFGSLLKVVSIPLKLRL
jgi:hypothetical protein